MYGWGAGHYGQTGLGEYSDSLLPKECVPFSKRTKVPSMMSFANMYEGHSEQANREDKIIQICAGGNHSMILT